MIHYISRDSLEKDMRKLIDNKSVSKKLVCLYGIEKIGKSFTLEYIKKEMLEYSLVMSLSLNYNNISNPVFLKTSIINLLRETGIAKEKSINFKELLFESFKGITLTFPGIEYNIESFVDGVDKTISDYESQIKTALNKDQLYVEKLSEIVSYVAKKCKRMLYILIDDIHFADMQIWAFLDLLFLKKLDIGLFITYDRNCPADVRKKIESLLKNFVNAPTIRHELKEFEIESTRKFLEQKVSHSQIDHLVEQVQTYTAGIPGYISILTNDIDALEKIKDNRDFKLLMLQLYESLTEDEQMVVKYIYLNANPIHTEILEALSEKEPNINFHKALESLNKRGIVRENDEYYELKLKELLNEIPSFTKNKIYKQLYNIYQNSRIKSTTEHIYYSNVIKLAKNIKEYDSYFDAVLKGSSFFIQNYKYEIAAEFIEEALNLKESTSDIKRKIDLVAQYIEALFSLRNMKRIMDVHKSLSTEELDYINENQSFILLKIGKAYYYENRPEDVYEVVYNVEEKNECDALSKTSILCASYDLQGDYNSSLKLYKQFISDTKRDSHSVYIMNVFIQMIENSFCECISKLDSAIEYFENYSPRSLVVIRYLAAAYNNKGIEFLMHNKNDSSSISLLNKSYALFKDYLPIEEHFPLNNIGLYHLLATCDVNKALSAFFEAFSRAISPLQKGYIAQNIASAYMSIENQNEALRYIDEASRMIALCPDPVAKNYLAYNSAYINSKNKIFATDISYLVKPQLELLNKKRQKLIKVPYKETNATDRRDFFSRVDFEPCELMFYN